MMNDDTQDEELIFVPANASQINLVDIGVSGDADYMSAADQWNALENYINGNEYLESRKGKYAERNGARLPFTNIFDIKIMQDFYIQTKETRHTLQVSFDIFNFGNLLNSDWGRVYSIYNSYALIKFAGFEADGTTPTYTFTDPGEIKSVSDAGIGGSRWYAQFGVRYLF
jgi:hypothetical protein